MSKDSFPSREVFAAKFPVVDDVKVRFFYNFFEPSESIDYIAHFGQKKAITKLTGEAERDALKRNVLQKSYPRFNIINFQKCLDGFYEEFDNEARSGLVSSNKKKINRSSSLTTEFLLGARFHAPGIRKKIMRQVRRIALSMGIDIDEPDYISQTDIANIVDSVTGTYISREDLIFLVSEEIFSDVIFPNEVLTTEEKPFDEAQTFKTTSHIDVRFVGDILANNQYRSYPPSKTLDHVVRSQEAARAASTSAINMDIDYEPDVEVIGSPEEIDAHIVPRMGTVGYVIRKYLMKSGRRTGLGPAGTFYIDGVHNTEFVDSKIAYGRQYLYEVSSVSLVEMSIDVEEEKEEPAIRKIRFLVESDPSKDIRVMTVEDEAPPPPDAIFYRYDFNESTLVIDWRHPITSQRDIKGFQVFRRRTIYDPFVLQVQYNFNDSRTASSVITGEDPHPNLVVETQFPVLAYEDSEFDRSSSYIYTVCSVDAHGYLSNYGTQTQVTFDQNTNRIRLKNISQPGAPRQYPNMYVSPLEAQNINSVRLTEDVMKDSMHKKMTVYLDADPAPVLASDTGKDLKHLAFTDQKGVYKFEVLNLDRQKSETLSITLERPSWYTMNKKFLYAQKAKMFGASAASLMSILKGKRKKF